MCITCERCGKLTRHYQTLANGKKVCADDRNCYEKVHYINHKARILSNLKARYAV